MNLRAIANACTSAINPNLLGSLLQSAGYGYPGDAAFTGAITTTTLTVSALSSGALAVGSAILGANTSPGTVVTARGTGNGGIGTYTVSPSQTVATEAMQAVGSGQRSPIWTTTTGVPMQFQALTSDELRQIDGLNISTVKRAVHMNGDLQGIDRPGVKGGDMLLAPTGLTGAAMDTWLVIEVMEAFDASGWCRLAVALQMPAQSQ